MSIRRTVLALGVSLLSGVACFWDESSVFYVPDLFFTEPASKQWVRVRHPQLPISFELPSNYAAQVEPALPHIAQPEPPGTRARTVETWGVRPFAKTRFFHYAIELTISMFTEKDRLDPERVSRLAAQARPARAELQAFLRDACRPGLLKQIEFSAERTVPIGACRGERARVGFIQTSPFASVAVEALVAPVPRQGVLFAEAYIPPEATEEERKELAPRIIDSIAIETCNEPTLRGLGVDPGIR